MRNWPCSADGCGEADALLAVVVAVYVQLGAHVVIDVAESFGCVAQ